MAVEKVVPLLEEETIEIEIAPVEDEVSFDSESTVMLEDGGAVINYEEDEDESEDEFDANLAEDMSDSELGELTSELISAYKDDLESRSEWLESYIEGLDLLGTNTDERSEPFRGASGVYHPLLAESATQFQSQAYKELLPKWSSPNKAHR
mgnify:FL=1